MKLVLVLSSKKQLEDVSKAYSQALLGNSGTVETTFDGSKLSGKSIFPDKFREAAFGLKRPANYQTVVRHKNSHIEFAFIDITHPYVDASLTGPKKIRGLSPHEKLTEFRKNTGDARSVLFIHNGGSVEGAINFKIFRNFDIDALQRNQILKQAGLIIKFGKAVKEQSMRSQEDWARVVEIDIPNTLSQSLPIRSFIETMTTSYGAKLINSPSGLTLKTLRTV